MGKVGEANGNRIASTERRKEMKTNDSIRITMINNNSILAVAVRKMQKKCAEK